MPEEFDLAWFQATLFGAVYPDLMPEQYDFAGIIAVSELASVKCWCPDLYPMALSIKITLILQASGLVDDSSSVSVTTAGGDYVAIVQEDEVFDTRRKFKIMSRAPGVLASSPAGILEGILERCKPPLAIGSLLAYGRRAFSCCGVSVDIADKAEMDNGY